MFEVWHKILITTLTMIEDFEDFQESPKWSHSARYRRFSFIYVFEIQGLDYE